MNSYSAIILHLCAFLYGLRLLAVLMIFMAMQNLYAQVYRFQGRPTPQQVRTEEELLKRLPLANDTVRVAMLDSLAWMYRGTDFARAMNYAQQASQEVERLGFPRVRAENNNYVGIIYRNLGNYPKAMQCFMEARRIAEKYGYKTEEGYALNNIGDIYRYEGKFVEARQYVLQSLQRFKELRDTAGLYYCAIRLGEIAQSLRDYPVSLDHFQDAFHYSKFFHNEVWEAGALNRTGQVYHLQGFYNQALEAFRAALRISERLPHDEDEQASILIEIGKTYRSQQQADSAILVLKRGLLLAERIGLKQQIREASKILAAIYTEQRRFEEALEYRTRQMAMNDSLYTEIGRREIEKISAKYELEKQQDAINVLNQSQKQERIIGLGLVVGVALLLVVAVLLYRNSRAERRANTEILRQQEILEQQSVEIETTNTALLEQNAELAALSNEKTELMNIVAHDLKNPISAVHGLADLITNGVVDAESLQETARQIVLTAERMLNLVTNILDSNRFETGLVTLQSVEFDILPIIEATCWQYQAIAATKHITIHYVPHLESATVCADEQAIMQVMDNLISNAVKYSPHKKNVFVKVRGYSPLADGHLSNDSKSTNAPMTNAPMTNELITKNQSANSQFVRIEIQDEGYGISPEDMPKLFGKFARLSARPTGGEHSTGLGLHIVKKLVEAMNGRVWCESEIGQGATFFVELPTLKS